MDWLLGTGEPSAELEEVDWAAGRAALEAAHPSAPAAERERFLRARGGDGAAAAAMYAEHLAWRAASLPLAADAPKFGAALPEWLFFHGTATDGTRITFVQAARYDAEAGSTTAYTLAAAALFDEHLARDGDEKCTVLVDTRGAEGWANPPATSLVGLIRELTGTLRANFPERMRRLVVYPVPWAATALWTMVQQFLDAETVAKVVLLSGPATRGSPPPPELFEYVALSEIRDDLRPRHEGSSAPSE